MPVDILSSIAFHPSSSLSGLSASNVLVGSIFLVQCSSFVCFFFFVSLEISFFSLKQSQLWTCGHTVTTQLSICPTGPVTNNLSTGGIFAHSLLCECADVTVMLEDSSITHGLRVKLCALPFDIHFYWIIVISYVYHEFLSTEGRLAFLLYDMAIYV